MRLLITGAAGQLGREWGDFCNRQGITCAAYGSAELDVTDDAAVEQKIRDFRPSAVINCAAYTAVDKAEEEPQKAFLINGDAVGKLAGLCKKYDAKLIHYSTDYVFSGGAEDRNRLESGFSEEAAPNPMNVYGASKLTGEQAVRQSGCDYLIIRTSWLCGRYGNNFVKTMLRLAAEGRQISVVNDQFGSPSFTENVVSNTHALLSANRRGIFNISSMGLCTWFDFAAEIFKQKGIEVSLNAVSGATFAAKAKRPSFSKLDIQKLSKIKGVKIESWQTGLASLLKQI